MPPRALPLLKVGGGARAPRAPWIRRLCYRHDILHLLAKFRSNRTIGGGVKVMTSYRFYNMAAIEPENYFRVKVYDGICLGRP